MQYLMKCSLLSGSYLQHSHYRQSRKSYMATLTFKQFGGLSGSWGVTCTKHLLMSVNNRRQRHYYYNDTNRRLLMMLNDSKSPLSQAVLSNYTDVKILVDTPIRGVRTLANSFMACASMVCVKFLCQLSIPVMRGLTD